MHDTVVSVLMLNRLQIIGGLVQIAFQLGVLVRSLIMAAKMIEQIEAQARVAGLPVIFLIDSVQVVGHFRAATLHVVLRCEH